MLRPDKDSYFGHQISSLRVLSLLIWLRLKDVKKDGDFNNISNFTKKQWYGPTPAGPLGIFNIAQSEK